MFSIIEGNREKISFEQPPHKVQRGGKEGKEVLVSRRISLFDRGIGRYASFSKIRDRVREWCLHSLIHTILDFEL